MVGYPVCWSSFGLQLQEAYLVSVDLVAAEDNVLVPASEEKDSWSPVKPRP